MSRPPTTARSRLGIAVLVLCGCSLGAGGCGGESEPAAGPAALRRSDPTRLRRLFEPLPGTGHLQLQEAPRGSVPGPLPEIEEQSLLLVVPSQGTLTVRLLAAAVPYDLALRQPGPGVRVVWEEQAQPRELSPGTFVCNLSWHCHLTRASDLVLKTLEGLAPDGLGPALDEHAPGWRTAVLGEWWWSLEGRRGHVRGWAGKDDWVPRRETSFSAGRSGRPSHGSFHPRREYNEVDLSAPILLGRWDWFYPGSGAGGGTQAFIDARERLKFEDLLPDGGVVAGGKTWTRAEAPFLSWALVASWAAAADAPAAAGGAR